MGKKQNLLNKRFTRLFVLSSFPKKENNQTQWLCLCDCGSRLAVTTSDLNSKGVQSCGCLNIENIVKRNTLHGYSIRGKKHPLYDTWAGMNARCSNKKHIAFKYYGERGIRVCEEWGKEPSIFIEWCLVNGWERGLTIDRINNDKNYCPENCRIASMLEQLQNTCRTKIIFFNNKSLTLREWSIETGINKDTLYSRIFKLNWDIEKALTKKTNNYYKEKVL